VVTLRPISCACGASASRLMSLSRFPGGTLPSLHPPLPAQCLTQHLGPSSRQVLPRPLPLPPWLPLSLLPDQGLLPPPLPVPPLMPRTPASVVHPPPSLAQPQLLLLLVLRLPLPLLPLLGLRGRIQGSCRTLLAPPLVADASALRLLSFSALCCAARGLPVTRPRCSWWSTSHRIWFSSRRLSWAHQGEAQPA